jgi:hypothetical protein
MQLSYQALVQMYFQALYSLGVDHRRTNAEVSILELLGR